MRKKAVHYAKTVIRSVNSIQLDEIAKLAPFITPTDEAVRSFALEALKAAEGLISSQPFHPDLMKGIVLFDAMYGMRYASDPNVPFKRGTVDEVMFPREILEGKGFGDCDDSVVLYCSLLESVGVHTALIKRPKHVLMAFKLEGMTLEKAQQMRLDESKYIPIDGYVWIPIETTLIGKGFAEAWKAGARQVKEGVEDVVTVQSAWERFGSVDMGRIWGSPETLPSPDPERLRARIRRDLNDRWVSDWRGMR